MKNQTSKTAIKTVTSALDSDAVLRSIPKFFGDDGKPNSVLKKCIDHFKDRFREVGKALASSTGGVLGKPSVKTETTSDGSRILMSVSVTGVATLPDSVAQALRVRLLTPSMKGAGVDLKSGSNVALENTGWGASLRDRINPCAYVLIHHDGAGTVHVVAAFLFHHPEDDVVSAARNKVQTYDELPIELLIPVRGGALYVDQSLIRVVTFDQLLFDGYSVYHPCKSYSLDDRFDPRGHQIIETARSSGATVGNLAALASRLGLKERDYKWRDDLAKGAMATAQANAARAAKEVALGALSPYGDPTPVTGTRAAGLAHYWLGMEAEDVDVRVDLAIMWDPFNSLSSQLRHDVAVIVPSTDVESEQSNYVGVAGREPFDLLDYAAMKPYILKATKSAEEDMNRRVEYANNRGLRALERASARG